MTSSALLPTFESTRCSLPWWSSPPTPLGIALASGFLSFLTHAQGAIGWALGWALVGVFFAGLALMALAMRQAQREVDYGIALQQHSVAAVIEASDSPHYSRRTQNEMVAYLNREHTGWTLGLPRNDP